MPDTATAPAPRSRSPRSLRYSEFMALFPLVRLMPVTVRVTLYRMVRDGRLTTARDLFTGSTVLIPTNESIPQEWSV